MMNGTADAQNPFGNMWMLMAMGDGKDIDPMMLAMMMGGQGNMNPMMLAMMMGGDKTDMRDMLLLSMMMNQNQSQTPFIRVPPCAAPTPTDNTQH